MLKRLFISILWALFFYTVVNFGMVQVFATLVFAHNDILASFASVWDKLDLILLPVSVISCIMLEYTSKLPRIYIRKERIDKMPALLLSMSSIKRGLKSWLLYGLIPFIVVLITSVMLIGDHVMVVIPGNIFYASLVLLYSIYYHMKRAGTGR